MLYTHARVLCRRLLYTQPNTVCCGLFYRHVDCYTDNCSLLWTFIQKSTLYCILLYGQMFCVVFCDTDKYLMLYTVLQTNALCWKLLCKFLLSSVSVILTRALWCCILLCWQARYVEDCYHTSSLCCRLLYWQARYVLDCYTDKHVTL